MTTLTVDTLEGFRTHVVMAFDPAKPHREHPKEWKTIWEDPLGRALFLCIRPRYLFSQYSLPMLADSVQRVQEHLQKKGMTLAELDPEALAGMVRLDFSLFRNEKADLDQEPPFAKEKRRRQWWAILQLALGNVKLTHEVNWMDQAQLPKGRELSPSL